MCGILLAVIPRGRLAVQCQFNADPFEESWKGLSSACSSRGPDFFKTEVRRITSQAGLELEVRIAGSELRLRGTHRIEQPHVSETGDGDAFCWNGEVFEGLNLDDSQNDGEELFKKLADLADVGLISEVLATLEGPYAFTYYHSASGRLYFGRDPLGRRSLLVHKPTPVNPYYILCSVSTGDTKLYALEELQTDHLFCLDLTSLDAICSAEQHTCSIPRSRPGSQSLPFAVLPQVNRALPSESDTCLVSSLDETPPALKEAVEGLLYHLDRSVRLRVESIPQSGNAGDARLGLLFSGGIDSTILAYLADRHLPPDEPIDLLNVAFENPRKILAQHNVENGHKPQKQNKMSARQVNGATPPSYLVPDRVGGLEELEELRGLCPRRTWNFVSVNVSYEESLSARPVVEALMFPCQTVMDLSLAMALYFASRGVGVVRNSADSPEEPYTSRVRVLLNGLGSDELLGGYGRHRTIFGPNGWQGVIDELQLEIDRLPTRNLGRDDRVISSHGKETRHPFLSLSLLSFLTNLPIQFKMDPRLPIGLGDKMLLRLAARKVGLVLASGRKKKAMQFGSHSARMEGGEKDRKGGMQLS